MNFIPVLGKILFSTFKKVLLMAIVDRWNPKTYARDKHYTYAGLSDQKLL